MFFGQRPPPPPPPPSLYSDALVVGTITCLVVLATAALLLIVSALPGQLIKSKKAPEVEEDDAGSDSESEPSVVGSDDQAASEEDDEEAYDDEGFFCDVSFPPGIAALGDMSGDSANKAKGKVDRWQEQMLEGWARPHQMLGERRTRQHKLYGMDGVEPCLFGQTSPNDLHQGSIGDCWLIAAMSGLAEFPLLVHRLFKQQQLAPDGRYDVRLYDAETEEWQVLTIDDLSLTLTLTSPSPSTLPLSLTLLPALLATRTRALALALTQMLTIDDLSLTLTPT